MIGLAATSEVAERPTQGTSQASFVRIAQSSSEATRQEVGRENVGTQAATEEDKSSSKAVVELEEVVVTGSHIRGAPSVTAVPDIIDGEVIRNSGYATLHQFMHNYVKNFGGGPSEDTDDVSAQGNFTDGAGINLRGLGTSATLVLVNGRRLAVAGLDTSFNDISLIPTSMIERVEVLLDGGSALYGTDAVAGVVNVILRKDFEGAETHARIASVTKGGLKEYGAGQTFGGTWESGNALISYDYLLREPLESSSRSYLASHDHRLQGGTDRRYTYSNPGNILDPATFEPILGIPKGQDGRALAAGELINDVNLSSLGAYGQQLGRQERHGFFGYAEQTIGNRASAFAEARYVERRADTKQPFQPQVLSVPSSNPFFVDPFGGSSAVYVAYDMTQDMGRSVSQSNVRDYTGTIGMTVDVGPSMQARVHVTYGEQDAFNYADGTRSSKLAEALSNPDPNAAFNPFGDGSHTNAEVLAGLRGTNAIQTASDMFSAAAILDGALVRLPAGDFKFAFGVDYQKADFDISQSLLNGSIPGAVLGREVKSVFGELLIPVLKSNSQTASSILDISLAGRFDDYSDFGQTRNPRIGARWQPFNDLTLRASWGTSFRAPNMASLAVTRNFAYDLPAVNPSGESVLALVKTGGNPALKSEESKNWSVGLHWEPRLLEGLSIDLGYYRIDFENRIELLAHPAYPVTRPEEFGRFAILNPTQAQLGEFCSLPYTKYYSDSLCTNASAIDALIDYRYQNMAQTLIEGSDLTANYSTEIAEDQDLLITVDASLVHRLEAGLSAKTMTDMVDTLGFPVDFRASASARWTYKDWLATTLSANYMDGYDDKQNYPFLRVESWLTFDLNLSARLARESSPSWLKSPVVSFGVVNLFDRAPPFVNNVEGYDPRNADPLGRFVSLSFTTQW